MARVGSGRCDSPKISNRSTTPHAETAMLRDDNGNGGGRPSTPRNVLGERLEVCSISPMTGFFRDGCCDTGREDIGSHTVCAVMTAAFLEFSKSRGNDLSTPMPEFGFRGLKPGDRWCLCAPRWQEALEAGQAPRVVLRATPEGALDHCSLADLKRFAADLACLQLPCLAIEDDLRGTSHNFGLKVGRVGKVKFEARIRELVENLRDLAVLVEPMLIVRQTLREQIVILHRRLLTVVRDDEVCRRLMTTPGVGPVVALTYRATVDVPARFRKSKSVGAVFGLTCSKYQSGEIDRSGSISRCGDEMMRVMLYEAAQSMLHSKKWSWLKAWAIQIARRRGMKKAIVALARRLAVIMHRIWVDGTEFRWTREPAAAAA